MNPLIRPVPIIQQGEGTWRDIVAAIGFAYLIGVAVVAWVGVENVRDDWRSPWSWLPFAIAPLWPFAWAWDAWRRRANRRQS